MSVVTQVCWALARECRDDDVVVVGVATPLAAAAVFVARETVAPGLSIVLGGAVDPPLVDVAETLVDPTFVTRRSAVVLGQRELLGLLQRGAFTLQFVSPAQVDLDGSVNTSRVRLADGWRRLPGCLALPDTSTLVGRLVAYRIGDDTRFLVRRVDHVTGLGRAPDVRARYGLAGRGVVAAITSAGRFDVGGPGWVDPIENEPAPDEVVELIERHIDPHRVLGLESPTGRSSARAALDALRTART
jgi:acyl CoA:acetate/3-ketoacid CoA transferase beta subunit